MLNRLGQLSIKTKITSVVLLLFIGSSWVLTYAIQRSLEKDMVALLEAQQFSAASYIAADIDAKIKQRIDLLNLNAKLVADYIESPANTREFLKGRIGLQALFQAGLVVIDRNGKGIADYPVVANRASATFGELEYFKEVIATGKTVVGKPRIGRFTQKPDVAIVAPILGKTGEITGVLVGFATLSDKSLFQQIEHGAAGKSGWILVSSPRDQLIVTSSDPARILRPLPAPGTSKMLDRFLAGYEGSGLSLNHLGVESLVSAKAVPSAGWMVHMALPTEEAFAPIRSMKAHAYQLVSILTLLATLAIWLLIRRSLRPLDNATSIIRAMATGKEEMHTLKLSGDREVQDLLVSFNTLVNQRRATEETLFASRQFVQATLDGLTAHICVLDERGIIIAVNRAWREFAAANQGVPLRVNEGTNYLAVCDGFAGEDDGAAAAFATGLRAVLAGHSSFFDLEYPCDSPDEQRWFLAVVSRLPGEGVVRVVVAHENVTKRKLAELRRADSEARLNTILDNSSVGITLVNDRQITWASRRMGQLFGYSAEEMTNKSTALFYVSQEAYEALGKQAYVHLQRGEQYSTEQEMRHRDGHSIWMRISGNAVDQSRPAEGSIWVFEDINDRKQMELRLQEALAFTETILTDSPVPMGVYQGAGQCVLANEAYASLVGATCEKLLAQNFRTIQSWQHSGLLEDSLAALSDGKQRRREIHVVTSFGQEVWLDTVLMSVVLQGEPHLLIQIFDLSERKRSEDALRRSEERLRMAQSIAQIGSWEFDIPSQVMTWSDEMFSLLELDSRSTTPSYECFFAVIHPDDRESTQFSLQQSIINRRPYDGAFRVSMPDGTYKHFHEHCETTYDSEGSPLCTVGTLQDVTLQILNEESLKESEERFRTIADYTYDWEYWQGPTNEILYINPACKRITGYSQADFVAHPDLITQIVHPEDRPLVETHHQGLPENNESSLDFRIITRSGDTRWIAHGCRAVYGRNGTPRGRRASNRDITDRKNAEQQIHQLAYFDSLTDLPNRRLLLDRLHHGMAQAKRFRRALTVMFLDLDGFKQINDTHGHDVGDALLKQVGVCLSACMRVGDTVARTGGDEFVVVLPEIAQVDDAILVAEKVIAAIQAPIHVNGLELRISTSIGIAVYPVNGPDAVQDLMIKADKAMYAAKTAGKNRYCLYVEPASDNTQA